MITIKAEYIDMPTRENFRKECFNCLTLLLRYSSLDLELNNFTFCLIDDINLNVNHTNTAYIIMLNLSVFISNLIKCCLAFTLDAFFFSQMHIENDCSPITFTRFFIIPKLSAGDF